MDVIDQIQAARRNLLDLSMRNRLLHFRPNKRRSIRVVDEMPNEVYDLLVLNERVMDFKARPSEQELPLGESDTSLGDESSVGTNEGLEGSAELSSIWELRSSGEQIPAKYVDRFLQTILDTETLQKRLFYINQQARSVFEEQGYSVLFLALGFLEWKESPDATEVRKAPLLLVPVELERAGVQKSFRLKWTGEEVFSNVSLSEKLKDIGVFLPSFQMPEEKSEVETYFDAVVETIKKMIGWRVLSDLYLDFFSFTKFVMYKDLDPKSWPSESELVDHALLKAVMEPSELNAKNEGFLPEDVDHKLAMKDLFHVMDADPFQVAVLEDIKSGFNLVVEGPPGTGKSQTIANAIAELLAAGKTVLFVSEKMAALEVVKNRLDHVGLGQFCLEIHSRKASKKDLLKELELSIQNPAPKGSTQTESIEEIESLRKELNEYARGLREPVGKLGRSPFGLFQMKEAANREFTRAGKPMPRVSWKNPGEHSNEDWNQALVCVKELSEIGTLVKPINKHPWRGCMPGLVLPTDEEEILIELRQCIAAISKLKNSAAMLANEARLAGMHTPKRIERAIQAGMLIAHTMRVEKDVLQNEDWDRSNGHAMCLIRQVADCQAAIAGVLTRFKRGALEEDVRGLLDQFRSQLIRHRRFFTLRWWRLVNKLRSLYKVRAPWKSKALIPDFERLLSAIDKRVEIRAQSERARALFGRLWDQERSQTRILSNFSEWITRFRPFIREGIVSDETLDLISSKGGNKNLEVVVNEVGALLKTFLEIRDGYFQRVGLSYGIAFGVEVANLELELLDERLRLHEASIRDLQKWSQYVAYREKTRATMANPVVEVLELDQVDPTNLVACFKGNFADSLLREAFKERPILGAFIGDLHEKKINRFQDLDRSIIRRNRHRLIERLYQNKPEIVGGASRGSEAGILLGEFGRKRGHMPIRRLFTYCGRLIQKIKPCFMMSPLSIAQFLDPRSINFDVILFDEASQVKPEDALGALLRGSQLVVMGDTRQLPPTSFFDSVVAGSEEEEVEPSDASVAEVESILHQCKRCFPSKLLSWHYRSRHESLIAVSNREFYDNRLLIFPSAIDKSDMLGVKFVHLRDAIYDRGKSGINRREAREVAKAAVEHYRLYPEKSLGVGAFNIRQQQAILEEIELQLIENRDMEDFFRSDRYEHFFVKNLETIQGDERDVIFISIGFGFDENGRLIQNFGPLNQAGGERRLNVLVTRAREKCVVFSNFRAADLQIDANSPFGLRALKTYLAFAEDRTILRDQASIDDADSPFEESVYEFLRDHGYGVRKQVGWASFKIDLAVLDPRNPGTYLAGIECDGHKYHSSPVARDRDRLRQQILEGLGWQIVRIWSTDWYRNRVDCQDRLLKALDLLKYSPSRLPQAPKSNDKNKEPMNDLRSDSGTRDDNSPQNVSHISLEDIVPRYECCKSLGPLRPSGELHRQSMNKLSIAVVEVVNAESPVHSDEVMRRIRSLWGLSRTGQRIHEALESGIKYALKNGYVKKKGEFLFKTGEQTVVPRRREDDPPPNIDFICDEEISEGLKLVLKHQFSTLLGDLVVQTCRVFGILATHESAARRIERIVRRLSDDGELEKLPNEMIKLPSTV